MIIYLIVFFVVTIVVIVFGLSQKGAKNVNKKLALVTGGANGLGQQICLKLATLGCNVAIADIDFTAAQKTAGMLVEMGVSAKAYQVDVSNYDEILQLKRNILSDLGEVDILVNNAGLIPYKTIFEQSSSDIERLTRVNFNSVILMTKCFLENMMERKTGHIVTVASVQGLYAYPFSMNYCATKFGVTGFMLSLIEFLRIKKMSEHVHATCILPDLIATREDIISAINPKFRMLKPEDVAAATVDAILRNKYFVTVPFHYGFAIKFFNILPFCLQHIYRDYIRQESTFLANEVK